MERRSMLRALAFTPVAWRLGGSPVDLRTSAEQMFVDYPTANPVELHERARVLLPFMTKALDPSMLTLAVDVACLCSVTAYISGRPLEGLRFADAATSLGEDAHRAELIGRGALQQARFYSAVVGSNQPVIALEHLERALRGSESGVMRAYILSCIAAERAALGNSKGVFHALDAADHQWHRGWGYGLYSTSSYLAGWSPSVLAGQTGRSLALLGMGDEALAMLGEAAAVPTRITQLPATWHVDSALAYLRISDPDPALASDAFRAAWETCQETNYTLGLQRLERILAAFPSSWKPLPGVRALEELTATTRPLLPPAP